MAVVEVCACRPSAAVVLGYRLPPTTCALCSSPDRACGCVIPTFIILLQEQLTLTLGIEYRCVIYCRKYTPHVASKLIQDRVRRLFALLEHSLIFDFFPRSRLAADYLGSMSNGIIHQKILQGRRALAPRVACMHCDAFLVVVRRISFHLPKRCSYISGPRRVAGFQHMVHVDELCDC